MNSFTDTYKTRHAVDVKIDHTWVSVDVLSEIVECIDTKGNFPVSERNAENAFVLRELVESCFITYSPVFLRYYPDRNYAYLVEFVNANQPKEND